MLRAAHRSVPGNPLLAESLYLAEYVERMGTGTLDMIRRCVEAGLPEPEFTVTDGFVTIVRRAALAARRTGGQAGGQAGPGEGQAEQPGEQALPSTNGTPQEIEGTTKKMAERLPKKPKSLPRKQELLPKKP